MCFLVGTENLMIYTTEEIVDIYNAPFLELLSWASSVHEKFHDRNGVQISSLISVKTGGCPEDCSYCPQSARYKTGIKIRKMMKVQDVIEQAVNAKSNNISRVCLGAAWRNVRDGEEFESVLEMVRQITKLDMEVCCTLGMLTENQAKRLEEAGLYAYNHNLDSSKEYYEKIISTRSYDDRLKTIDNLRKTSITLCSGGIIGMGESLWDRCDMLRVLSNMNPQPESVPINALVPVEGTPLGNEGRIDIFEFVRMIATARILLPRSQVRLAAGRSRLSDEAQALCFLAGANSIFAGDKLLVTPNNKESEDRRLFEKLGLRPQRPFERVARREVVEAADSKIPSLDEKPTWSRPPIRLKQSI